MSRKLTEGVACQWVESTKKKFELELARKLFRNSSLSLSLLEMLKKFELELGQKLEAQYQKLELSSKLKLEPTQNI